jgi:hypothetical protein
VDPRAGIDDVEKRKFLTLSGLELRPPRSSSPISSCYTDYAIPGGSRVTHYGFQNPGNPIDPDGSKFSEDENAELAPCLIMPGICIRGV